MAKENNAQETTIIKATPKKADGQKDEQPERYRLCGMDGSGKYAWRKERPTVKTGTAGQTAGTSADRKTGCK